MSITIDDVYTAVNNHITSNDQIEKSGNKITVYTNIGPRKKQVRIERLMKLLQNLKNDLASIYPANRIIYNRQGSGSTIGRIEIIRDKEKELVVLIKPPKEPPILRSGALNEEMFADLIFESVDYAEEDGKKLKVLITDGMTDVEIAAVEKAVRVGGQNRKPDVKIITETGREYKISLKMQDFLAWHSYANNDSDTIRQAIKILNNLPNITAAFGKGSNGVSAISTINEVKKFCYGEYGINDSVDFIIKSNLTPKSFSYNSANSLLTINVNKLYVRNNLDHYEQIRKDCYLLISKASGFNIGSDPKYRGYKLSFVPAKLASNTLPGKR